ncbi:transposase IS240-A [Ferroglobus placidus DSM 10642]|uniref:Transposase IS240-A n=1 Tax=Ferroglobus placidus (strain DSM 10642 / AEDII12DO) TaxID=589924 RepID=D3RZZ4_FERPA|nr:DDE-type integrase/transposase/recombinase [Ferroglobus placidus]ADC66057.1 transposase IS240-A [Ferroglobus placidus DSM 10642]ADC66251.1 transposase IS240-A [Ferroglobus placidus DSM 10642]ADC66394.1 transposase IS240-A [Ferroglobus placidus DSM 10642]ADC66572.1 transposase IS240-A [Ferroglobus placidus DSM 10642]ADC66632.1 transposase IS240-A [Ferroglobus placidus DSM 10642]
MKLKKLIEELELFERERVPNDIRILGVATYVQTSSTRRTAKILSEFRPVSHTAVWKWIKKFEEKLPISTEKKRRNLVAIDETIVKANKKKFYIFAAVDVERNELILMRVYTTRNILTARSFVKEVLNYCENEPKFLIDKAPWLRKAIESLGLEFKHETFRKEKSG